MQWAGLLLVVLAYCAPLLLQVEGTCDCFGGYCIGTTCYCPEGKTYDGNQNCVDALSVCCPNFAFSVPTGNGMKCECKPGLVINMDNDECIADNADECAVSGACTNEVCCNSATGKECISWADVIAKFPSDASKEPTIEAEKLPALQFRLACRVKYHKWLRTDKECNVKWDDCNNIPSGY